MHRSRVKLGLAALLLVLPFVTFFLVDTVSLEKPAFFSLFILSPLIALTLSLMTWRSGPHHTASAVVFFAALLYALLLVAGVFSGLNARIFLHNYCTVDEPLDCEAVSVAQAAGSAEVSFVLRNVGAEVVTFSAVSLEDDYACSIAPADVGPREQALVVCEFAPKPQGRIGLAVTVATSLGDRVVTVISRVD